MNHLAKLAVKSFLLKLNCSDILGFAFPLLTRDTIRFGDTKVRLDDVIRIGAAVALPQVIQTVVALVHANEQPAVGDAPRVLDTLIQKGIGSLPAVRREPRSPF